MRERISLLIAYLLLVGVVAWLSFDIRRTLDNVESGVCATAEIAVANELSNLVIAAEEGELSESVERIISEYIELGEALQEQCGTTFLDLVGEP